MTKNYVCHASYLRNLTSCDCHLWYTCVKSWYLQVFFFNFFKILIFWVVRWLKRQKMVWNDKKFCLLHSISQEPYIIWLSFMVHMCKMIISPDCFFIFSKFWFFWLLEGNSAKNGPKWQKILSTALHISGTIYQVTVIYGTHL